MKVLFVCMGNICRSPMAEGLIRHRLNKTPGGNQIEVDSAGTHSYHIGSPPDHRAESAAQRRGVNISKLMARQVIPTDFEYFDYVLAMDQDNLEFLRGMAEERYHEKIKLLLSYSETNRDGDVPDPYYGGATGFERVLDLIEDASDRLIAELTKK